MECKWTVPTKNEHCDSFMGCDEIVCNFFLRPLALIVCSGFYGRPLSPQTKKKKVTGNFNLNNSEGKSQKCEIFTLDSIFFFLRIFVTCQFISYNCELSKLWEFTIAFNYPVVKTSFHRFQWNIDILHMAEVTKCCWNVRDQLNIIDLKNEN